jgi:DNA-binding MarR family transcriptional regulator
MSNEAKYESLKYIDEVGFASSSEIADYRGVTYGCQSTLLRRYWKYGLLHRASGEGKEKIYTLSTRGQERLDWLSDQFEPKQDVIDEPAGYFKNLKRCKVKRNDELEDFLRNLKRCRVIRTDDDYITIERE